MHGGLLSIALLVIVGLLFALINILLDIVISLKRRK